MPGVLHALDSDEQLMRNAAKGDLPAFERLVKRHQNRVYRMAYSMLQNEEDAWDVSQEIFIKIYHARSKYVENAKFTTWLYRITNNAIIDRIRHLKRHNHLNSMDDEATPELEAEQKNAQESLQLAEITDQVAQALNRLSERQRSMVILRYYEGFSIDEIAQSFECAAGTVKATLFQAIRNLRKHLGHLDVTQSEVAS